MKMNQNGVVEVEVEATQNKEIEAFDARIKEILRQTDSLQRYINAHELGLAEIAARAIAVYCQGARLMKQALDDTIEEGE